MADEEPPRRLRRGRQRVPMVKMENENNLQVTFSKRRTGLFKKASELCTLCGAEVALVVFSPGNKVFSFGHPSVEAVLDRYAGGAGLGLGYGLGLGFPAEPEVPPAAMELIEAHRNATLRDLNMQLMRMMARVEAERKRGDAMTRQRHASMAHRWWETPVDLINDEDQLLHLHRALQDLKATVTLRTDRLTIHTTAAAAAVTTPFYSYNDDNNNNNDNNDINYNMSIAAAGFGFGESSSSGSGTVNNNAYLPYNNDQLGSYGRASGFYYDEP